MRITRPQVRNVNAKKDEDCTYKRKWNLGQEIQDDVIRIGKPA